MKKTRKRIEITLADIEMLVARFSVQKNSQRARMLKAIRSFYGSAETVSKVKRIKTETLLPKVFPEYKALSTSEKKAQLSKYKRKFTSLKASFNGACRRAYWDESNPLRVGDLPLRMGIGRSNIFCFLKQTRAEELEDLKLQMESLKQTMIDNGLDPTLDLDMGEIHQKQALKKKEKQVAEKQEDLTSVVAEEETSGLLTRSKPEEAESEAKADDQTQRDDGEEEVDETVSVEEQKETGDNIFNELDQEDEADLTEAQARKKLDKTLLHMAKMFKVLHRLGKANKIDQTALSELIQQLLDEVSSLEDEIERLKQEQRRLQEQDEYADVDDVYEYEGESGEGVAYRVIHIPQEKAIVSKVVDEEVQGTEEVELPDYYLDNHPITNKMFAEFVDKTNYVTVAERRGYGWVYQAQGWVHDHAKTGIRRIQKRGFVQLPGVSWREPHGNDLRYEHLLEHPVVQVCFMDIKAYSSWVGRSLPTLAQWEAASYQGGLVAKYTWGDEDRRDACNNRERQVQLTERVGEYEKNIYRLYDMCGNIWEVCVVPGVEDYIYLKGGSWHSLFEDCQINVVLRAGLFRYDNITGFRLAGQPSEKQLEFSGNAVLNKTDSPDPESQPKTAPVIE